ACVLPLRLRREPDRPAGWECSRCPRLRREPLAKLLGLRVIDPIYGKPVPDSAVGLARESPHQRRPLALRHLVLTGPEAAGECHGHRAFVGPPLRLAQRTAHSKRSRWSPAEFYLRYPAFVTGFGPPERVGLGR